MAYKQDLQLNDYSKSFLSYKVHQIICVKGIADNGVDFDHFIDINRNLIWSKLEKLLPDYKEDSYGYFVECSMCLAPVIYTAEQYLSVLSEEQFLKQFKKQLEWTSHEQTLEYCFTLLKGNIDTEHILALLLMMPVFERSLGDVYLTKGKQCPSLLKDLLVTDELQNILGPTVIQILRVLIGPAISLNIRNVTWHGFPAPGEIKPRYGFFILHIILSISKILTDQGIEPGEITHRTFVTFPQITAVKTVFPDMPEDVLTFKGLISESSFVVPQMESLWSYAIDCYKANRYTDSLVLFLPQLEHGLRLIYANVNNIPERVLTAENTKLYTTFDEILADTLPDGTENQLRYHIGDNYVSLLLDILRYPHGPRLRDRLSHGETFFYEKDCDNPTACDHYNIELEIIAKHILSLCMSFCILYTPPNSKYQSETFVKKIHNAAQSYDSVYHPVSICISKIKKLSTELDKWEFFERPMQEDINTVVKWEELYCDEDDFKNSNVYSAGLVLIDFAGKFLSIDVLSWLKPYRHLSSKILDLCDNLKVNTLYRNSTFTSTGHHTTPGTCKIDNNGNKEEEVLGILRRIISEAIDVSHNVSTSINLKYDQWTSKSLRSRQRETYKRMLDVIPSISSGLRLVLLIAVLHFKMITTKCQCGTDQRKYIKFLKLVLQYCENLRSFTSLDKNRWDEAEKYTKQFISSCCKVL